MLLFGSAVSTECQASKVALSMSQFLMFNMHRAAPAGNIARNKKTMETPLPVSIGLLRHAEGRKKNILMISTIMVFLFHLNIAIDIETLAAFPKP